jgi:rod shape-determining protein MreC
MFSVDRIISYKLSALNTNIKEIYLSNILLVNNTFSKFFNQEKQIIQLKQQIQKNEQDKMLNLTNDNISNDKNISLTKVLVVSYIDFNDFSKVILNYKLEINNIVALITNDGYSAGIAIKKDNQVIGFLNHNPKSNYAVFIGSKKIPGITHGNKNKEYITIKFIPLWQEINIGDEVVTSGMDNIFSKGIKVGKVINIKKLSTTWEAYVKPYANVYNKSYFYLVNNSIIE